MENKRPQIVFVHGGDSFDTAEAFYDFLRAREFDPYAPEWQSWRKWLESEVADTHDFIYISMPNKLNADYTAWAIWFDKVVPYLRNGVTLIGYSLGGGFLLRYLSENTIPVTIKQLHLVAGVVDDKECPDVGGFKVDLATWRGFKNDIAAVHLWYAQDDPYVPYHHGERLAAAYPASILHTFTDRGHFFQPEFPELKEVLLA